MLKKIRLRFISAAMLAFFTVIVLIAGLVNVVNYFVETDRLDGAIDIILDYSRTLPPPEMNGPSNLVPHEEPFKPFPDIEDNYMMRYFIVIADTDGRIVGTALDNIASVSDSEAVSYAEKVLSGKSQHGYIDGYRYSLVQQGEGTMLIFLNAERELRSMQSLFFLTVFIAVCSLLLVFLLVVLLSRRAIKPLVQNIEIQKQFITDAGHELKTPLTSISTSLDVIELEHGKDEWTENIRSQTDRMTGLVRELVTLSRLDEVRQVQKEEFDLSSTCWEMLEVYMPHARASGKEIEGKIEEGIIYTGDKEAISKMLSVLLDNSIKYSDDACKISFILDRYKGKARIVVANPCTYDTIPDTKRLFDRFYRPDGSRSSSTGGNGIGLSIARSVAESHGGEISASCPDGKFMTITAIF